MDIIRLLAIILLVLIVCYSVRENFTVHKYKENKINVWSLNEEALGVPGEDHLVTFVNNKDACERKLLKKENFHSAAVKLEPNKKGKYRCVLVSKKANRIVGSEASREHGYDVMFKEQGEIYPMTVTGGAETLEVIDEMPMGNKGQRVCRMKCINTPECTSSVSIGDRCILKKGEINNKNILEGELFFKDTEEENEKGKKGKKDTEEENERGKKDKKDKK